jgi:hypothetical protein
VDSKIFLMESKIILTLWIYQEYPAKTTAKQREKFLTSALVKAEFFYQKLAKNGESLLRFEVSDKIMCTKNHDAVIFVTKERTTGFKEFLNQSCPVSIPTLKSCKLQPLDCAEECHYGQISKIQLK